MNDLSRRRFVEGAGAVVTVGALAGCSGGNGNGGGDGDGGDVPQAIEDHLSDASNYEGSIADMTGESAVTIDVGAGSNNLAFDPAAVRVGAGTTVTWEWTGEGGQHNVVSVEGSDAEFESELTDEEGSTFEQTFEGAGIQLYVCEPHQAQGMKGAVEVVEA